MSPDLRAIKQALNVSDDCIGNSGHVRIGDVLRELVLILVLLLRAGIGGRGVGNLLLLAT